MIKYRQVFIDDIFYARCTWIIVTHVTIVNPARAKPVQRNTRQEMAPTFVAHRRGCFDRQSRHRLPGYEGPADGRNHRRHCGRHSCRALFSSEQQRRRHRERTTTHAKAIIKRRCPTGFSLSRCASRRLANCNSPQPLGLGAMFSPGVSTTPCASFRDKKYDRRSFLRRMRRPSRDYSDYLPPRREWHRTCSPPRSSSRSFHAANRAARNETDREHLERGLMEWGGRIRAFASRKTGEFIN